MHEKAGRSHEEVRPALPHWQPEPWPPTAQLLQPPSRPWRAWLNPSAAASGGAPQPRRGAHHSRSSAPSTDDSPRRTLRSANHARGKCLRSWHCEAPAPGPPRRHPGRGRARRAPRRLPLHALACRRRHRRPLRDCARHRLRRARRRRRRLLRRRGAGGTRGGHRGRWTQACAPARRGLEAPELSGAAEGEKQRPTRAG